MANSVDPDQTAPSGVGLSGSTLFAHTCLSENLGSFQYEVIVNLFILSLQLLSMVCNFTVTYFLHHHFTFLWPFIFVNFSRTTSIS